MDLKKKIRTVPDWPKKGVMFKDITTLLKDANALSFAMNEMVDYCISNSLHPDKIVAAEARGFIFGSILAHELHAGFVPVRKEGKLPSKTVRQNFETEYSTETFEMHADALNSGDSVIIVDDLLATGGTALAAARLVESQGAKVKAFCFLVSLKFLKGREKLENAGYTVFSLVDYEKEE